MTDIKAVWRQNQDYIWRTLKKVPYCRIPLQDPLPVIVDWRPDAPPVFPPPIKFVEFRREYSRPEGQGDLLRIVGTLDDAQVVVGTWHL